MKSLFEKINDLSRPSLRFQVPRASDLSNLMYGFKFKREELKGIVELLLPAFEERDIVFDNDKLLTNGFRKWLMRQENASVEIGNQAVAIIFKNPMNLAQVAESWNEDYRDYLKKLLDVVFVSREEFKKLNKAYLEKYPGSTGLPVVNYPPERPTWGARSAEEYFSLDYRLWPSLRLALGLSEPAVAGYAEIPDKGLATYQGEANAIEKIEAFKENIALYEINPRTVPMKATQAKTLESSLDWKSDFQKASSSLRYYYVRNFALWYGLATSKLPVSDLKDIATAYSYGLREIFLSVSMNNGDAIFQTALPYFDKYYSAMFDSQICATFIKAMKRSILANALNKDGKAVWLSAAELVENSLWSIHPAERMGVRESYMNYYVFNELSDQQLTKYNAVNQIARGQLFAYLASFAAAGLLDMAYKPVGATINVVFWRCVKYVRLTPLGKYVFGLEKEYNPDQAERVDAQASPELFFDPDRLVLTTNNETTAKLLKKEIGQQIGTCRLVVDKNVFMNKIKTEGELKAKIKRLLKLSKEKKLPEIWKDFFEKAGEGLKAITAEETEYVYYRVNLKCDGVVDVLRNDAEVRAMITLVEGGGFLVKEDEVKKLTSLLAKRGIVLPKPPADDPYDYYYRRW